MPRGIGLPPSSSGHPSIHDGQSTGRDSLELFTLSKLLLAVEFPVVQAQPMAQQKGRLEKPPR